MVFSKEGWGSNGITIKRECALYAFHPNVQEMEKRDADLTPKQQIDRLLRPGSSYFNLNPFEVLQIDPGVSIEEARKKYKRLCILVQPDKNHGDKQRAHIAFEIVNKAWKTLDGEDTRKRCMEIIEEARQRTEYAIAEKRKKQKREGCGTEVEEDDPVKYNFALHVMTMKIFAEMQIRRRELEIRDAEERKRKREAEIEEEKRSKLNKEWDKNFEESREQRTNSWKTFLAGVGAGNAKRKIIKGFKPPKIKDLNKLFTLSNLHV